MIVTTHSGQRFDPLNFEPKNVVLEDIALALSRLCRFCGHTSVFYSVADHSCNLAEIAEEAGLDIQHQVAALFHDAAEAYLGDMISPIKHLEQLWSYRALEQDYMEKIGFVFGFIESDLDVIKEYDRKLTTREYEQFLLGNPKAVKWVDHPYQRFLDMARTLQAKRFH